jgi:hypothetical protein
MHGNDIGDEASLLFDAQEPRARVIVVNLTPEQVAFLQHFAEEALAGRHMLCLFWRLVVGLGKLALALSAIVGAFAVATGWRVHQ